MTTVASVPSRRARANTVRRWVFLATVLAGGAVGGAVVINAVIPAPKTGAAPVVAVSAAAPVLPSLKSVSPAITAVKISGLRLEIDSNINSPTEPGYVDRAADLIKPLALAFQHAHAEDTDGVRLVAMNFTTTGVDRLGNQAPAALFTVVFPADELRAANLQNLGPYSTMGLVKTVAALPAGEEILGQWCADNDRVADRFCKIATAR